MRYKCFTQEEEDEVLCIMGGARPECGGSRPDGARKTFIRDRSADPRPDNGAVALASDSGALPETASAPPPPAERRLRQRESPQEPFDNHGLSRLSLACK